MPVSTLSLTSGSQVQEDEHFQLSFGHPSVELWDQLLLGQWIYPSLKSWTYWCPSCLIPFTALLPLFAHTIRRESQLFSANKVWKLNNKKALTIRVNKLYSCLLCQLVEEIRFLLLALAYTTSDVALGSKLGMRWLLHYITSSPTLGNSTSLSDVCLIISKLSDFS